MTQEPQGAQGFARRLFVAVDRMGRSFTNRELAERLSARLAPLGISYGSTAVTEWLKGRSEPKLVVMEALAAVLGVRFAWLAAGDGPMTADRGNDAGAVEREPAPHPRPAGRPTPSGSGYVITPPEHLDRAVSLPRPERPAAKPAAKRASGDKKRRG